MGGCGCPSPETCGCFFGATGDIVPSGTGSKDNPMLLAIAPGKFLWLVGASDDLPGVPENGQPVWQQDDGQLVVWDEALGLWRPLSTGGIQSHQQFGSNDSPAYPGPNLIATLSIPDPGWPYLLIAEAQVSLEGGNDDDQWNTSLSSVGMSTAGQITMRSSKFLPGQPCEGSSALPMCFTTRTGGCSITLSYTSSRSSATAIPHAPAGSGTNCIRALVIPA